MVRVMNRENLKSVIEALLFTSDRPLEPKDICGWLPEVRVGDVRKALDELREEYEAMARSFVIKKVARGYQFRTRAEYAPHILRMFKSTPTRLSRAAMETLAIIAYKQPILRHEIERLRGVDVGGILRTLMEKDLIRIMGRKNLPGRPLIYGTTKRFLEVFDLESIDALPKLKEIKALEAETAHEGTPTDTGAQQDEKTGEEEGGNGSGPTAAA